MQPATEAQAGEAVLLWPVVLSPQLAVSEARSTAGMRTKERIVQVFAKLLDAVPYESITVLQIADACGVSRQTFYNHFFDKNDLVNWICERFLRETVYQSGARIAWRDAFALYLEALRSNQRFFVALLQGPEAAQLVGAHSEMVYEYLNNVYMRSTGEVLDHGGMFAVKMFSYGVICALANWLYSGTATPVDAIVDGTEAAMPPFIRQLFV